MEDHTVNILAGYVDEMDITAMRDTITPVPDNGILTLGLEKKGNEIENVQYEVYSLDGGTTYLQDTVRDLTGSSVTLDVNRGLPEGVQEAVLKVILETAEKEQIFIIRGSSGSPGCPLQNVWILPCSSTTRRSERRMV